VHISNSLLQDRSSSKNPPRIKCVNICILQPIHSFLPQELQWRLYVNILNDFLMQLSLFLQQSFSTRTREQSARFMQQLLQSTYSLLVTRALDLPKPVNQITDSLQINPRLFEPVSSFPTELTKATAALPSKCAKKYKMNGCTSIRQPNVTAALFITAR
jgi:hypothetical protein